MEKWIDYVITGVFAGLLVMTVVPGLYYKYSENKDIGLLKSLFTTFIVISGLASCALFVVLLRKEILRCYQWFCRLLGREPQLEAGAPEGNPEGGDPPREVAPGPAPEAAPALVPASSPSSSSGDPTSSSSVASTSSGAAAEKIEMRPMSSGKSGCASALETAM